MIPAGSSEALAATVAAGGVAVFPTDTVYGLCCDPHSEHAVQRLYELKGRPAHKPAAILFTALDLALAALPELGERTRGALLALLPGPLTVLLANPRARFPLAGGELLGVRVIDIGLALPGPVLQSSANRAGASDARRLEEVPQPIRDGADLLVDGGELPGVASTVLDLSAFETHGAWRVVREGARSEAAIAATFGKLG